MPEYTMLATSTGGQTSLFVPFIAQRGKAPEKEWAQSRIGRKAFQVGWDDRYPSRFGLHSCSDDLILLVSVHRWRDLRSFSHSRYPIVFVDFLTFHKPIGTNSLASPILHTLFIIIPARKNSGWSGFLLWHRRMRHEYPSSWTPLALNFVGRHPS